ncbi:hypothetical protein SLEP1_g7549 [Rubroshorea leprosula]|uniref:Uncharacterized protein n=1 Tax=Rubroshorea leprosula TaxID=152421 RepID=A0AAV5I800_9ROSI|nr:hypothetical protein SLEP1_g7549 [Rubroshorea leprosula]
MNPTEDLLSIYFPDCIDTDADADADAGFDAENDHSDEFLSNIEKNVIVDIRSLWLETVIQRRSHSIVFQASCDVQFLRVSNVYCVKIGEDDLIGLKLPQIFNIFSVSS